MKVIDLMSICKDNNLNDVQSARFCNFIKLWRDEREMDVDYMDEWASRFRKQSEYVRADNHTRTFLVKVDGVDAIDMCKNQYKLLGWSDKGIAGEVKQICELISNDE